MAIDSYGAPIKPVLQPTSSTPTPICRKVVLKNINIITLSFIVIIITLSIIITGNNFDVQLGFIIRLVFKDELPGCKENVLQATQGRMLPGAKRGQISKEIRKMSNPSLCLVLFVKVQRFRLWIALRLRLWWLERCAKSPRVPFVRRSRPLRINNY